MVDLKQKDETKHCACMDLFGIFFYSICIYCTQTSCLAFGLEEFF